MTKRMLIDSTHAEETRVVVMEGKRLEEFDYESKLRKPIKGNIYLAKITRVEPSLQAAFVNFGGNRHGFLPFSEIHPDYFRIPIADREALMAEQEEMLKEHEEEERRAEEEDKAAEEAEKNGGKAKKDDTKKEDPEVQDESGAEAGAELEAEPEIEEEEEGDNIGNAIPDEDDEDDIDDNIGNRPDVEPDGTNKNNKNRGRNNNRNNNRGGRGRGRGRGNNDRNNRGRSANKNSKRTEKYSDDNFSAEERFRFSLRRKYKIQEVIKRGQIVLVQASKEERGNKGAAFTSYLSLPGRYCVLMPNSPRGGGVSRKIANYKDRARMRELLKEMEVPKGMSVILRTAGVQRTKSEVKRDLDYLMRLWDSIRELTLESSAPDLVYEEANLIKRTIRDIYTRDVEEIVVAGERGLKAAKDFMKMMIPSHVKKVKEHKADEAPLFNKYGAESQIADIGEVEVRLPSGGYLVINPTEALVSIDVNSGRSTKERHIEETALKTNLEAAAEVARQLRLRDLGGLVVIDFIDMENRRNNGKVERKIRDALSPDRARIQNSRISSFGLMELSRQRMNPSLTESQYETCSHCLGLGRTRSADATSIMVLRALEEEGAKKRADEVIVHVSNAVALYILNNKRALLSEIEQRHNFKVIIRVDHEAAPSAFRTEVSRPSGRDDKAQDNEKDDKPRRSRGGRGRGRDRNNDRHKNEKSDESQSEDAKQETVKDAPKEEPKTEEDKPKDTKKKAAPKKATKKSEAKEEKTEEKPKKKPAAKKADKEDKPAKVEKKPAAKKVKKSKANDDTKPSAASQHETVNEAPKKKKKGWWSK